MRWSFAFFMFLFVSSCQKPFNPDPVDSTDSTAVFTLIGSPNTCSRIVLSGIYKTNKSLDSLNKITIDVDVSKTGNWTASANSVNGILFSGSGSFNTAGNQKIILQGSGTPVKSGANSFIINAGSNHCSFNLNVDSIGASSPNIAPKANAGVDQVVVLPVNTATLAGSGEDTDGFITTYLWREITGSGIPVIENPTRAGTVINNLIAGNYKFELTVTDNAGATGKDTVSIIVPETILAGTLAVQQELDATDPINDSMNYNSGKLTKIKSNYHQERFINYSNNRISTIEYWYHDPNGDFYKTLIHTFVYDVNGHVTQIYETQIPINTTFLHEEFTYNSDSTLYERKTHFLGGRLLRDNIFLYTNGNLTTFINRTPDNMGAPDTMYITYDSRINTFNNIYPQYYLLDLQSDYYGSFSSEMFYFSKNYPATFGISPVSVSINSATQKPSEIKFNDILILRYVYN
ncbi:MAG: hypothetical protein ABI834_03345 [Ginsengibacter sp.]